MLYRVALEIDRFHFFKPIPIFSKNFSPIISQLVTDTDIPKFAYRYIFRFFNEVFWLKWVWIDYSLTYGSLTNEVD